MAAPTLSSVRQEVERVTREVPRDDLARKTETIRALHERAELERVAAINELARALRKFDAVIASIHALPDTIASDRDLLLAKTREQRQWAFNLMREINPNQAWFWTEEWQAGEREVDRQIAAGEGSTYHTDEEFDAALRALRPDGADLIAPIRNLPATVRRSKRPAT